MNASVIDVNTKLAAVYYNGGKLNLFRVQLDVTLSGLKDQLDKINHQLNRKDTRSVVNVEYRCPSTGSDGSIQFTQMKLMDDDDDVKTMVSIFGQYSTKGSIELDASLVRSFEDIRKSLIWPRIYEEIRALLDKLNEKVSLADY